MFDTWREDGEDKKNPRRLWVWLVAKFPAFKVYFGSVDLWYPLPHSQRTKWKKHVFPNIPKTSEVQWENDDYSNHGILRCQFSDNPISISYHGSASSNCVFHLKEKISNIRDMDLDIQTQTNKNIPNVPFLS